jgi:hypothetical protein
MKILDVTKSAIDLKEYVKRSAQESDYKTLITEDTLIRIDGRPAILYKRLDVDLEPLRQTLRTIKYDTGARALGLKSTSRVFGYQPRIALRRDFCTATTLAHKTPSKNRVVCDYGKQIVGIYQEYFPDVFDSHNKWVTSKIKNEWKMQETPFTSGIINKNNPLKYHFDAGNIKHVCSCMLALKRSCGGGFLSLPEIGVGLEIADQSLTIFDGQSLLHGVTPIKKLADNSERYTIVYYTLHQMWKCETVTEELARIRKLKMERERKRAGIPTEAELKVTQHGVEEDEPNGV